MKKLLIIIVLGFAAVATLTLCERENSVKSTDETNLQKTLPGEGAAAQNLAAEIKRWLNVDIFYGVREDMDIEKRIIKCKQTCPDCICVIVQRPLETKSSLEGNNKKVVRLISGSDTIYSTADKLNANTLREIGLSEIKY